MDSGPIPWFVQTTTINQIPVFYTHMTSFRVIDQSIQSILDPIYAILDQYHIDHWIWHIDSEEFGGRAVDRSVPFMTMFSTLAEQYEHGLLQIDVLRPTAYMHIQLALLWPKLSGTIRDRIRITNIPRELQESTEDFT